MVLKLLLVVVPLKKDGVTGHVIKYFLEITEENVLTDSKNLNIICF